MQVLNQSQVATTEIPRSVLNKPIISLQKQAEICSKENRNLLKNFCQKQMNYISSLKMINYGIKVSLETQFGKEQRQLADQMFGHVIQFVKMHTQFYHSLKKMIEYNQQMNEQILQLLDLHFKRLICYGPYIQRTGLTLKDLQKIFIQNKKKVSEIFRDFQQPVENYILVPIHHISYYNTFLKQYIKNLKKQNPIYKKLKKTQQLLQNILLFKLNMITDNPSAQILEFLEDLFNGFVVPEVIIQVPILYKGISCILYIMREENGKVGIAALHNKNNTLQSQFIITVTDSTYLNVFTDTLNVKNRLGICCVDQFHMIKLEQDKNVHLLVEKFKLLQSGARFIHIRPHNSYQYITNNFHLSFNLLGMQKLFKSGKSSSYENCYVIKLQNYQFNLCQYIFITINKLERIISQVKKSLKITDINNIQGQNFLNKIKQKNNDLQQSKWISIEEILNSLVRNINIRNHGQYFFYNLKVFQGMWYIMTLQSQNLKNCTCNLCAKINFDEQDIINLRYYVDGYDQENSKICIKYLMKAREQLINKLRMKQNFFNQKFCKKGFSSFEKSQLINLNTNKMGWKLQRYFKKLPEQRVITISYRNIEGILCKLDVQQTYKQQTVQTIIKKICQQLEIIYHRDYNLCNYNIKKQQMIYDDHEYISDIMQTKPDLYFTKIYYFSDWVQESLLQYQNTNNKIKGRKLHLNIGEIIHKIKTNSNIKNTNSLKQLLKYLVQILKDQKILKIEQITQIKLKQYINENYYNLITQNFISKLRQSIIILEQQKRNISEIYKDVIRNYHLIEQFIIPHSLIYIKTQIISSKIYENYSAQISVNYQQIYLQVQQLNKWLKLKHNQYRMEIIGNLISFKQINSHEIKWIRTQNSYPLWRKIKTYQKMYNQIKKKGNQSLLKSNILSDDYIFI